jgi:hypothetical protein
MGVAMVQVGEMAMDMCHLAMPVSVGVPCRGGQAGMHVVVMAVVVAMAVDVLQGFVRVFVLVAIEEEQGDADEQEQCCRDMPPEERLSEEREGERRAEEGLVGGREVVECSLKRNEVLEDLRSGDEGSQSRCGLLGGAPDLTRCSSEAPRSGGPGCSEGTCLDRE